MKCLDTSFLIDLTRGSEAAKRVLAGSGAEGTVTTELNALELYVGAHPGGHPSPRVLEAVEEVLNRLEVLPLTRAASLRAAEIASSLRSKGQDLGLLDVLIAAIALAHGVETIVTKDASDFRRVPKIRVETY